MQCLDQVIFREQAKKANVNPSLNCSTRKSCLTLGSTLRHDQHRQEPHPATNGSH